MGGVSESKKQLGKISLQQKLVGADDKKAGNPARRSRLATAEALRALSAQHGLPAVDLGEQVIQLGLLRLIPSEIARERIALPMRLEGDHLLLAMAVPPPQDAIEELEFVSGKPVAAHVTIA